MVLYGALFRSKHIQSRFFYKLCKDKPFITVDTLLKKIMPTDDTICCLVPCSNSILSLQNFHNTKHQALAISCNVNTIFWLKYIISDFFSSKMF